MNLSDFDITITNPHHPQIHECLIKHKENSIKFGILIRSNQAPPPEWVFQQYLQSPTAFFIEAEIITTTIVEVVAQNLITASAGPSNP